MRKTVTAGTARAYDGQWYGWCNYLDSLEWGKDPYLRDMSETEKASTVTRYLQSRYDEGARGKSATSVTAGLRLAFTSALLP